MSSDIDLTFVCVNQSFNPVIMIMSVMMYEKTIIINFVENAKK